MSTTVAALNELPRAAAKSGTAANNTANTTNPANEAKTLAELGKNDKVVVNKVDNSKSNDEELGDEFMSESEFGLEKPKSTTGANITAASGANTTTITVSTSNAKPTVNMGPKLTDVSESDKLEDSKPSSVNNIATMADNESGSAANESGSAANESGSAANELEKDAEKDAENDAESEDEKSAAELVAAAAAQIVNKTIKNTAGQPAKLANKTIKSTGKLLATGKQEQIMKKAMLMMNESGRLNVITDEPAPSIVKLNTPVNKAQIKLRTFRQNFEKELVEMRRKTPLQIQTLKAELANIEFAEIGNKNIMAGLLELIDDHELKLLTIEKMLKHGDITLSF
jgi:hypothetical protein